MNRDNPNENDLRLMALIEQILGLSQDTEVAGRIMLLGPTGQFIGDASLSTADLEAATEALAQWNATKAAHQETLPPAPTVAVDPVLEAELEEYCIGLDAGFLMQVAQEDPNCAVAAFDEAVSDWDGEL
ncbi:hypothetical protein SAM23877_p012 (plasmid) [Streptomyces ambofaciens ATCC 23877]|uniref:Uncharacterized protein n=1 Tax=Streptomyces ambofaciens (strain ATCC 23877 / 3486 / DSM 40053 / JCM 4204 / NBRC 12836 / NRRL B-2516) TaxID=278992 RepID=A0A0K2B6C6_STRA7|nr:hypothetical protein [Streptomyces ambofaciens]AKZ60721.1 hypothetical protein SAM23877_p012 [Streptomyces ambofaciens ATCC 23877]